MDKCTIELHNIFSIYVKAPENNMAWLRPLRQTEYGLLLQRLGHKLDKPEWNGELSDEKQTPR